MTASAPIPAEVAGRMSNPPTASEAPGAQAPTQARADTARPTLRSQIAENPLMSFFCLLIVALLAAAIASPHFRIDDLILRIDDLNLRIDDTIHYIDRTNHRIDDTNLRIDDTNRRIDRLEARMVAEFEKVDARFEKMDERFEKMDERFEKMDERFEKVDERFDAVEAGLHELDRKLTALIAALRATDDVNAAMEGRLGDASG